MLWYITFIALLNLCIGYVWGAFFRPCPRCTRAREMGIALPTAAVIRAMESKPVASSSAATLAATTNITNTTSPIAQATAAAPTEMRSSALGAGEAGEPLAANDAAKPSPHWAEQAVPVDPETGLVTRAYAEQLLSQLVPDEANPRPATVALVEMAPIDWIGEQPHDAIDQRLLGGVSSIVRQALGNDQTAARFSDQQLLLVVPHEDIYQATRRAEEVRQRVATTEFMADGRAFQTTVTCALTEISLDRSGSKLFEFLQEALDEAKRYGGNRTFMHDGNSPTPVVPPELPVTPQQLAI